jgi:hypothetical protein
VDQKRAAEALRAEAEREHADLKALSASGRRDRLAECYRNEKPVVVGLSIDPSQRAVILARPTCDDLAGRLVAAAASDQEARQLAELNETLRRPPVSPSPTPQASRSTPAEPPSEPEPR